MTAQQYAIQEMLPELEKRHKSFIAFRKELNPIMRKLVSRQISKQQKLNLFYTPTHSTSQLVAHCFFCKGEVSFNDYSKYYSK